jgi:hypothetical protein
MLRDLTRRPHSVPRPRLRPSQVLVVLIAVLALLGTACGRQVIPKSYGDTTKKNFKKGCEAEAKTPPSTTEGTATTTRESEDKRIATANQVCTCTYAGLVKKIPFSEFKKLNEELSKDPGPLPEKFLQILDACKKDPTKYKLPASAN